MPRDTPAATGSSGRPHVPRRRRPPPPRTRRVVALLRISMSSLLLSGRDRLDDSNGIEAGALRGHLGFTRRRSVEDVEADLVFGDMDRTVEADARRPLRQLLSRRTRSPLAVCELGRSAAGDVCLDEVARHAVDATTAEGRWKRQNL